MTKFTYIELTNRDESLSTKVFREDFNSWNYKRGLVCQTCTLKRFNSLPWVCRNCKWPKSCLGYLCVVFRAPKNIIFVFHVFSRFVILYQFSNCSKKVKMMLRVSLGPHLVRCILLMLIWKKYLITIRSRLRSKGSFTRPMFLALRCSFFDTLKRLKIGPRNIHLSRILKDKAAEKQH